MNIIAIDTSSTSGSIAISKDNQLTFMSYLDIRVTHSERLMPQLDFGLKQSRLHVKEIDLLCLANGPGSFTGLRIGLSTVKGLAFAQEIPVLAFNTLEVLAYNAFGVSKPILCLIDAKMQEIYGAVYHPNLSPLVRPQNEKPDIFLKTIPSAVFAIGNGVLKYKKLLLNHASEVQFGLFHQHQIVASQMLSIVQTMSDIPKYDFEAISKLEPFYLRKSQAELIQKEKQGVKK